MSVFLKVAFAAVVIFGTGSYGLYYLMSGEEANTLTQKVVDNSKRKLALSEKSETEDENEDLRNTRTRREATNIQISEDQDVSDEEEDEEDSEVTERTVRGSLERQKTHTEKLLELERQYGRTVSVNFQIVTPIPVPVDKKGNQIRERQYLFENITRSNSFSDEKINKLDNNLVAKRFKEYLILADKSHELWDIKHRQLVEYLKTNSYAGGYNFGYMYPKRTSKNDLASKCFKAYKTDPGSSVFYSLLWSGTVQEDWDSIWHWCTLPQYWGKLRPNGWPGR